MTEEELQAKMLDSHAEAIRARGQI